MFIIKFKDGTQAIVNTLVLLASDTLGYMRGNLYDSCFIDNIDKIVRLFE